MMITKLVSCLLATTLMGLSQVSAGQQATQSAPPSPEVVKKRLDSMPTRLPRPTPVAPPSTERIEDLLAFKAPWVWQIDSAEIEKSHNFGTASAPVYKQRFEAKVSLKENLYKLVDDPYQSTESPYETAQRYGNKRIVKTTAKAGYTHTLRGVATTVYLNGQYNTFFEFENLPADMGRALNEFEGKVLVQGMPEERQFSAERERQRKADYTAHKKEHALQHTEAEEEARHKAVEEARRRAAEAEAARKAAQ
jgi:hypothetical protein